jgi:hypothetical protein
VDVAEAESNNKAVMAGASLAGRLVTEGAICGPSSSERSTSSQYGVVLVMGRLRPEAVSVR